MKKLLKKSLALSLAMVMVLSLGACTKDKEEPASGGGSTETKVETNVGGDETTPAPAEEEKDYSEHYTYSYASIQITESTDYNSPDDAMTQYWEQKYNFDWDIISISSDKWDSTVNTWAYAEDLPDVTIFDYKHPQMMDLYSNSPSAGRRDGQT